MLEHVTAENGGASTQETISANAPSKVFDRDQVIYREGDPTKHIYTVLKGLVCTYKMLLDGRRQIASFYLPGDSFGLEDISAHTLSAEAITRSDLAIINRKSALSRAQGELQTGAELTAWAMEELIRSQRYLLMLSQSAEGRVASFLLGMAERLRSEREVHLLMSRRHIADHLGLTVETVCRTFRKLTSMGVIASKSHTVLLTDLVRLKCLCD